MMLQLGYNTTKAINNRLENLLMIVPCILLIISALFVKTADLDTHYSGTYFSFSFGNVEFFLWALLIVPFILHLFLKQQNIGNQAIIKGHILISILLMVAVLFTYDLYIPYNGVVSGSFWGLPYQRQWMEATTSTFVIICSQFLLQLLFSMYALIKLVP